jgi:hypothetical protein
MGKRNLGLGVGRETQRGKLMSDSYRDIKAPSDITEDVRDTIETVFDGYYADEPRIDWHAFLDKVESMGLYNFGSDMDSPVVKEIKKIVKQLRNAN